jgi:nucleoid DNA-binding protein
MKKIVKDSIIQNLKGDVGLADGEAKILLNNFFESLAEEVQNGTNVKFHNFGTFSPFLTKPRKGKNFKTGEIIEIPSKKEIKFKRSEKKA